MRYDLALKYLDSFLNFEVSPPQDPRQFNLRRMNHLLDWFAHPERTFASVLVGGTNGKGSTANFLASILSANGYRTGLYTSPHLSDPRERIRLNGRMISKSEMAGLITVVKRMVALRQKTIASLGPVTFFEIFTLLAILYFAKRRVRFAVFEVGMGGRLDATRSVCPQVCVLTPIGYDHMNYLGATIGSIAREKAAIIHPGASVVSSIQARGAAKVIRNRMRKTGAEGRCLGSAFRTGNERCSRQGSTFDFRMGEIRVPGLRIRMPGRFQVENAATATAAAFVLAARKGDRLLPEKIRLGLRRVFWPGRLEIVRRGGRTFLLDGAHNKNSIRCLCASLSLLFPKSRKIVVLGTSREKNLRHILKPLAAAADCFLVTKSRHPKAQEPKVILEALSALEVPKPAFWAASAGEALRMLGRLGHEDALVVITGSLCVVAEAREYLRCRKSI